MAFCNHAAFDRMNTDNLHGWAQESTHLKPPTVAGGVPRAATKSTRLLTVVAAAVAIAILLGVFPSVDKDQTIQVSILTRPSGQQTSLRAMFQRAIRNTSGQTTQLMVRASAQYNLKAIEDPEPYQQFFASLSKAIFLTAPQVD